MKSDINDLCEAFLAALTNAGYAVKSIENYKQVSNRFKKFCAENGYDTYTVNIGQIFADNVFNEETGAFVGYRNVMYGRFVRLINSFYLQGTFDFSMVTKEKNLPKSIHLIEIYQDYMEHLKTQYSNIGTIGFFQNGMLHLLRYMEDGGILTLKDLAVSDVVNYICSWSQKHQRNVLCILRNIFRHFGREDLYFAVAGIHPYRTKRIVPMFTDNEIMSIEEVLSSPSVSHRDAAIFFLGLTTGMRAVDVVDLRLANIDWDNETIFFQQSKTGNAVCLPLTVDIGNSIYRYILEERPRVDDDHVFLRSQAPFIPLGGHSTCYYIVSNILQRAGIQKDGRIWGMCMLRHNAASMMVQNSIIWLKGQGASTRTINLRITSIRSFLKYCGQEDFELRGIYESVCQIQKLKEEKHPILYLRPEATAAILSAYDMNTQKHRRNRMILILLYDTGARVQELADLDIESLHLDVPNPYISIIGKGRKRRNVPIMRKTVAHLNSYLKEFHPSEQSAPLFYSMRDGKPHRLSTDSISLVVGTAAKMARETCNAVPENVHCHLFRKTKAMDLYKNGIPLPFIMQLLGHESISTTSGFYAFATLEMMSDAINKSVPIIGGTEKLWKNKNAKQALYTLD